jgi:kynurenine formamidase
MARRIIDLTLTLHNGMATYPVHWHPFVEITQLGRFGIENRESRKLVLGTHTGTHVDAPGHFIPGGATIEQIPLEQVCGMALVLDFSLLPPSHEISAAEMEQAVRGRDVERTLMRFDWSQHFGSLSYYTEHPYLSDDAARWLVAKGCQLLAMDTPQADSPRNGYKSGNDSPVHKIFLGSGGVFCENMANLNELKKEFVELIIAPLKIQGGDGSPVRAFAIIEE